MNLAEAAKAMRRAGEKLRDAGVAMRDITQQINEEK